MSFPEFFEPENQIDPPNNPIFDDENGELVDDDPNDEFEDDED